jgi:hypothetical protein
VPAGVLKFKRDSEMALEASGLPYTILRPSRLTDGPYTSYDLNTLLQVWATVALVYKLQCQGGVGWMSSFVEDILVNCCCSDIAMTCAVIPAYRPPLIAQAYQSHFKVSKQV